MEKELENKLRQIAKDFHETITGTLWPSGFEFPSEGCENALINQCWGMARISLEENSRVGEDPPAAT
jgi:hypothetical protein